MKRLTVALSLAAFALSAAPLSVPAQSADSLIAKYIQASGGMARIQALQSLRRTGKFTGGGGFEAVVVQENKRPSSVREEFSIQGMTGINAYDGKNGWKIEPWQGKRDPEALGEEEMHGILDDADFDGPLVNYQAKGNRVEYQGIEQVEGSDACIRASSRSRGATPTNSRSHARTATSASTIWILSTTSPSESTRSA